MILISDWDLEIDSACCQRAFQIASASWKPRTLIGGIPLGVLRRKVPRKITLCNWERFAFVWFYRRYPSLLESTHIINPQTLVRWHRQGFRAYRRWKSFNQGGRPPIDKDLRKLIRDMGLANPSWGAPRIHGEQDFPGKSGGTFDSVS